MWAGKKGTWPMCSSFPHDVDDLVVLVNSSRGPCKATKQKSASLVEHATGREGFLKGNLHYFPLLLCPDGTQIDPRR